MARALHGLRCMNMERSNTLLTQQLRDRDLFDERILEAFREVDRQQFVTAELREFAYRDSPLPIGAGQTISQPFVVALTAHALQLRGDERVLEVGTGSGYAAAILSRLAREVYTTERLTVLASSARARLMSLGYSNVFVQRSDGTLGWSEHAPYDAIAVAAAGPNIPQTLISQLAPGGRLVMPIGAKDRQQLVRVTLQEDGELSKESLGSVRFVPLLGAEGWPEQNLVQTPHAQKAASEVVEHVAKRGSSGLRAVVQPLRSVDDPDLTQMIERIGDARIVLLGESTHGTSEFYRLRAAITKHLVEHCGFNFVAVEADWPDAARVDDYVRGDSPSNQVPFTPFSRFPTWMWRNEETKTFAKWLRAHNLDQPNATLHVGFHGLDLYSMFTSMAVVIDYLRKVDPPSADAATARYGALTPWQRDPTAYGRAVLTGNYPKTEHEVIETLRQLLEKRATYMRVGETSFFDAVQNARVVADSERYYRAMYYGSVESWNLRDTHMFETLESLLKFYGPSSRAVVWAHNSHVGDARATELGALGEHNIGQLCRERFGEQVWSVGFGTDRGTVAAATHWNAPLQKMVLQPSHPESYGALFRSLNIPRFSLPLRSLKDPSLLRELGSSRLERAVGVIYRPQSERRSHHFEADLANQFDEYIWVNDSHAVRALGATKLSEAGMPETYPFGI